MPPCPHVTIGCRVKSRLFFVWTVESGEGKGGGFAFLL